MDHSLTASDHIWVVSGFRKSAASSLSTPGVLALLAPYFPPDFTIQRTKQGQPVGHSLLGNCPYLSVAHAGDCLVIALSRNAIGIDIELIKTRAHINKITKRYFSGHEPQISLEDFYRSWTAREAFVKVGGQGLRELARITVLPKTDIWGIGFGKQVDHQVAFKIWKEHYIIAVCRPAQAPNTLCYFSMRL